MFNREELHVLIDALVIKFSNLERQIKTSTCKVNVERRKQEQDELLTLLLKTINLSDTAQ